MMKNKKNNITLINIISNVVLQGVNILSWFIIPKIILSYFGSNTNGLVSSLNQFLSYISLVEGGITGVVTANLYKPLVEKNNEKISSVVNTANSFFKKIGLLFAAYSLIVAIVYPLLFNTGFSFGYVFSLTIVLSLNLLVQYTMSLTYKTLLNADKKVYIVSISQIIVLLLTILLGYLSVKIYPSIHVLKLITGLLYLIQPLIYRHFVKKYFVLNDDAPKDNELISNRWSGFAINIAAFIHFSTDVSILTIFADLSLVSVYSVYTIVTNGLRSIINAVANAINPTIGLAYAGGKLDKLNEKFDVYEFIIFFIVFFVFSVASMLITPFVMIYTAGINDANYLQYVFGYLIVLSEGLYLIKLPHLSLAYSANKFKELTKPAFIEAFINIVVSTVLVIYFGIIGVAIGTICGMTYRMVYQVYFTKKIISNRKSSSFYKKMLIFGTGTVFGVIISNLIVPACTFELYNWLINAILYSLIFGIIYLVCSYIFYKKELLIMYKYIKRKK